MLAIYGDIPARLRLSNDRQLDTKATATWAAHTYAPALAHILGEYYGPQRELGW